MARIVCICGEHLSNSNNPEIEHIVFEDSEWIALMNSKINDPVLDIQWPRHSYWKCTRCERLHFFRQDSDSAIAIYKKERGAQE